jgi:glycerophosphoryl diester phosphodiesterase
MSQKNATLEYPTLIAAHRGGAGLNPENSRMAFLKAIALGVDQIETDVHLTADAQPVLIHDPTLERTTLGSGAVQDFTFLELQQIYLRDTDQATILHLDELLQLLQPTTSNLRLELKVNSSRQPYQRLCERVVLALHQHQMLERTTISSFHWAYLQDYQKLIPKADCIALVKRNYFTQQGGLTAILHQIKSLGLNQIALHFEQFDPSMVLEAKNQRIRFGLYAVNSEDGIRQALKAKVRVFTTDYPNIALLIQSKL